MSKFEIGPELFERMEAYLLATMSDQDKLAFEGELSNNPELRNELELMRENLLAVDLAGFEREVREVIDKGSAETEDAGTTWFKPWMSIAAAVALLVGVLAIYRANDPYARVFSENYVVDVGLPVNMGDTEHVAFQDAMVDFKSGAYADALRKWGVLKENGPQSDTLDYFYACAMLESGMDAEARAIFDRLKSMSGPFAKKSQWYSVMASVRLRDKTAVQNETPLADSEYADRIKALQAKLKER